jgi:hypothetical protein
MKTAMKIAMLALVLAFSASAQFQIVMSTDASSDGTTVHESVALAYSGSCPNCGYAYHTWNGSLVDSGTGRNCSFNAGAPANSALNIGCALDILLPWGGNQDYTATATIKGLCSVIGLFFNAVIKLPTVSVRFGSSSYRNMGCISRGNNMWVCTVQAAGNNCPAKCTTKTTLPVIGTPDKFFQCTDVVVNGNCAGGECYTTSGIGFCANP